MANWVRNLLDFTYEGEYVAEFEEMMNTICDEHGYIDFNKIIPMPESLNVDAGSVENDVLCEAAEYLIQNCESAIGKDMWNKYLTEDLRVALMVNYSKLPDDLRDNVYITNLINYGESSWYEWCWKNWGCKWNAKSCSPCGCDLEFETPWDAPHPVIEEIHRRFPNIVIDHHWADEAIGENCGEKTYGLKIWERSFNTKRDQIEFACDVWGENPKDFIDEDDE